MIFVLYAMFFGTSIIAIFFLAIRKTSEHKRAVEKLKKIEENSPQYTQFKVLPYGVKPLLVEHSNLGKMRFTLTPTHFKEMNSSIYSIPIKAKYNEGEIGFELMINALPFTSKGEEPVDARKLTGIMLDGDSIIADNFLKVLAHLFEVELSNKAQIVKSLFLFSEEEKVNSESLYKGHEFILFFGDKNVSDTTPAIRLTINLEKGDVIIEELDPIFRPIIIDRLTFKPNIR